MGKLKKQRCVLPRRHKVSHFGNGRSYIHTELCLSPSTVSRNVEKSGVLTSQNTLEYDSPESSTQDQLFYVADCHDGYLFYVALPTTGTYFTSLIPGRALILRP